MDISPLDSGMYRYRFRELMQDRLRADQITRPERSSILFTDLVSLQNTSRSFIPAPQGVGEPLHNLVDDFRQDIETPPDTIKQPEPRPDSWTADSALQSMVAAESPPSVYAKRQIENEVRRLKKLKRACPYCRYEGTCTATYIRCGDRQQYSTPESRHQRRMPHRCRYVPQNQGRYVVIVDDDSVVREFCRNSLLLFFRYNGDRIITSNSADSALDLFNRFKIDDRRCVLCIIDVNMPGMNGYELVDELYYRNYDVEVILMQENPERIPKPEGYAGDNEVIPGRAFVRKAITKPFHSADFVQEIRKLGLAALSETETA